MISQVDHNYTMTMMKGIIDHCKDESTVISNKRYVDKSFSRTEEAKKDNHWLETLSRVDGWK